MSRPESLKPAAATLTEASPELDVAVRLVPPGVDATDADAGAAGSTAAQAPQTTRGRGEPHRTAGAPRTTKASPSPKTPSHDPLSPPGPTAPAKSPSEAITPHGEAGRPPVSLHSPLATGAVARKIEAWMTAPEPGTQEPALHDERLDEEDPGPPPSRLSGLRNMLVSLGRRSLIEDEYGGEETDSEPCFERATVRPAYHEAPSAESEASAPVRLTAPPEFLRPQAAPEAEKDKEALRPTPPVPRRERESPDEIQTLPSWRGQYRKKRYPPI